MLYDQVSGNQAVQDQVIGNQAVQDQVIRRSYLIPQNTAEAVAHERVYHSVEEARRVV